MITAELNGRSLRINPQVAHREVEGQVLFLLPEEHALHTLNDSGRRVWLGLLAGRTLDQIASDLADSYGIPADQAGNDVRGLMSELVDMGILVSE